MKFTLAKLKATGRRPRVHPNGFVQFDVERNVLRLNVWPAEPIPGHPGRIHPIHNHVFDINSTIIHGALTNDIYTFYPSTSAATHVLHEAKRIGVDNSELTVLSSERGWALGFMRREASRTYKPGERYSLNRNVFHDSVPHGLTATMMILERGSAVYNPVVAVPLMVNPMNDFRRDVFDEDLLWDIIAQVL